MGILKLARKVGECTLECGVAFGGRRLDGAFCLSFVQTFPRYIGPEVNVFCPPFFLLA